MVPSKKTMPRTIRTNGPANDRWRLGGRGAMGGGVITGLDIFHLARRRLLGTRSRILRNAWHSGSRRHRGRRKARRSRRYRSYVTCHRRVTLHQLHNADHQQDRGPGSAKPDVRCAIEQKQNTQGDQHRWTYKPAAPAVLALAEGSAGADQSPLLGEQPNAEEDQDQRPETIEPELEQSGGVQEEQHAQADENGCTGWNFGAFEFLASTKCRGQSE